VAKGREGPRGAGDGDGEGEVGGGVLLRREGEGGDGRGAVHGRAAEEPADARVRLHLHHRRVALKKEEGLRGLRVE